MQRRSFLMALSAVPLAWAVSARGPCFRSLGRWRAKPKDAYRDGLAQLAPLVAIGPV